jgi:hypothetical protein
VEDFDTWAARLEFGFDAWRRLVGEDLHDYMIRNNIRAWDRKFNQMSSRCSAPGCNYPINEADSYHVNGYGSVCNLCHYLYSLVASRAYWVALQQAADEERKRKKWDDRGNK